MASSARWWESDKAATHAHVVAAFKSIDQSQATRRSDSARYLSMYESKEIRSLDGLDWAKAGGALDREGLKENLVRSVVDAATAKISTSRPRPRFLTSGNFEMKGRAVRRGLFVEGVYHQESVYVQGQDVFRDGGIYGTGLFKVTPDYARGRICIERVLEHEVGVDNTDGKYRRPRSMFHHKTISRSVAKAKWPGKTTAIEDAGRLRSNDGTSEDIDDPISVLEAWHLPSGPDAHDGLHVICTDKGELERNEHKRERFPILPWRWKPRSLGWHGMGLIEDIAPQQLSLDELNDVISEILGSMSVRGGVKKGSQIDFNQITDAPISLYEYGTDPIAWSQDPGPPRDILDERDRCHQSAYHQSGISQLSATSQKPAGVTAAVALQELKDTESERFMDVGQRWDWYLAVDLAELVLDAAEDLADNPKSADLSVRVPTGADSFERVRWSEFGKDQRDDYQIVPWPAALLPREPAGRVEKINYLMQMFPQAAPLFATLIQHPDTDAAMKLISAPVDAVIQDLEEMEKGNFITPEPFLDFSTAKMLALANYLNLRNQRAPEQALEAHRQYLISLQDMIEQQQATAMAQQQMGPGGPMQGPGGPPGAPPGMVGP